MFVHNVILGMLVSSAGEVSREILVFSNTKAIVEYGNATNLDVITSRMSVTTELVGKTVTTG